MASDLWLLPAMSQVYLTADQYRQPEFVMILKNFNTIWQQSLFYNKMIKEGGYHMSMGMNIAVLMGMVLYIAIFAVFFALAYFILKKAIKNGLVEAYQEIERLKQQ